VLNVSPPDEARAVATVEGDTVASIGDNRKMIVFGLDQVPEMMRGEACACSASRTAACPISRRSTRRRADVDRYGRRASR